MLKSVDAVMAQVEAELVDAYKGIIEDVWTNILVETPQWTGSATASWRLGVDRQRTDETRIVRAGDNKGQKGDSEGIQAARDASAGELNSFKRLGQTVYMTNAVEYAGKLESGGEWLRSVNQPGKMMERAVAQAVSQYGGRSGI